MVIVVLSFVSVVLFTIYAVLIIFYRQSWLSIKDFKFQVLDFNAATKISVIISARDEEENMAVCLNSIMQQSYPKNLFEVIVVDDHSTDKTAEIILSYAAQNVKLISLQNYVAAHTINSYKKKAIEIAIQQAIGTLIVTTDADCIAPPHWLCTIAAFYQKTNAALIVMPVAIKNSNNFLQIFQALDFMTLQGITGSAVHKKHLSMCNGANLAYTQKAFNEVGGFKNIDAIASGDDMLLMHKIFKQYPYKVLFLKSKDVIIETQPMLTFKKFINQRIRWASKADKYDDKRIFWVLLMVYFFNCILVVLPVYGLFSSTNFWVFKLWIVLLLLKTLVELFFIYPVAKFFKKEKILFWFLIMQPFHILYTLIAGWMGKFGKYNWKDRIVK